MVVMESSTRTLRPVVTGSSVLALIYRDGVMLACDTIASYGTMCRYTNVPRVQPIGKHTMVCASGEMSDFQYITDLLNQVEMNDWLCADHDGYAMKSKEFASQLARVMYQRRSNFNPLFNSVIVAGKDKDEENYLGYVDMYGTIYEEKFLATGLGRYFGLTLLREKHRPDMTSEEARALLEECMTILFYRDTLASDRIQISTATAAGVEVEAPKRLDSKWNYEAWTTPTSQMSLSGCAW